jgi:hypothetical protein
MEPDGSPACDHGAQRDCVTELWDVRKGARQRDN